MLDLNLAKVEQIKQLMMHRSFCIEVEIFFFVSVQASSWRHKIRPLLWRCCYTKLLSLTSVFKFNPRLFRSCYFTKVSWHINLGFSFSLLIFFSTMTSPVFAAVALPKSLDTSILASPSRFWFSFPLWPRLFSKLLLYQSLWHFNLGFSFSLLIFFSPVFAAVALPKSLDTTILASPSRFWFSFPLRPRMFSQLLLYQSLLTLQSWLLLLAFDFLFHCSLACFLILPYSGRSKAIFGWSAAFKALTVEKSWTQNNFAVCDTSCSWDFFIGHSAKFSITVDCFKKLD